MNATEKFLGYEVEATGETGGGKVAYRVYGSRGAVYELHREKKDPNSMYATNRNGYICQLKGNGWFSDRTGQLECVYAR